MNTERRFTATEWNDWLDSHEAPGFFMAILNGEIKDKLHVWDTYVFVDKNDDGYVYFQINEDKIENDIKLLKANFNNNVQFDMSILKCDGVSTFKGIKISGLTRVQKPLEGVKYLKIEYLAFCYAKRVEEGISGIEIKPCPG